MHPFVLSIANGPDINTCHVGTRTRMGDESLIIKPRHDWNRLEVETSLPYPYVMYSW